METLKEIQIDESWGWLEKREFPKLPRLNTENMEEIMQLLSHGKAVAYDGISDILFKQKENKDKSHDEFQPDLCDKSMSTLRNLWRANLDDFLSEEDSWGARLVALNKVFPKIPKRTEMRPILIQSPIVKLLEGRFLPALKKYLSEELVISQTGFIPKMGTHVNINRAIQRIKLRTDKKRPVYGLFIDFANAYNSVPHTLLFKKLRGKTIFSEEEITFLEQLYARYRIRLGNKSLRVNKGLAQGSIISPALFNIFIEDLAFELKNEANINLMDILMYADDILTICSSIEQVRKAIKIIDSWCERNGMTLNKRKSGIVVFSNRKATSIPLMRTERIKIMNRRQRLRMRINWVPSREDILGVPICKEYKYLGTILSPKLTAKPQTNYIKKKSAHIYTKLFPYLVNASADGKRDIFMTMIMPLFNPAIVLLHFEPSESHKKNLESLHRGIFKQFMGISKRTSNKLVDEMIRVDLRSLANSVVQMATSKWELRKGNKNTNWTTPEKKVNCLRGVPASWCQLINKQVKPCLKCKTKGTVTSTKHMRDVHGMTITHPLEILKKEILPITEKKFELVVTNGSEKKNIISRRRIQNKVTPIIEKYLKQYLDVEERLYKQMGEEVTC